MAESSRDNGGDSPGKPVLRKVIEATNVAKKLVMNKKSEVVLFSSTAIALYGYDQGMMSLINTNYDYLATLQIDSTDPLVAVIVAVYYLGCAAGSVLASVFSDKEGRKPSIFICLATTVLGNLIMFISGLGGWGGAPAIATMLIGRTVLGLGVGGIDAVIPVYSSELNDDDSRGRALAQEFQANIFGLNMAFIINVLATRVLGKSSQWSWRIPIIVMQVYPVLLLSYIYRLPESPRWHMAKEQDEKAKQALGDIYNDDDAKQAFEKLETARKEEESDPVAYMDLLFTWGSQFHPTVVTVCGQVNQALTGIGAISVYGPQLFELLGFGVEEAEHITIGNYVLYFFMMTFAWLLVDKLGRRKLMVWTSAIMTGCFILLTIFGALTMDSHINVPKTPPAVLGVIVLYIYTSAFGIGWLAEPWLIPTEIYPSPARAKGAAISVVVWGFANFAITFLTPVLFNNLSYWIFLIFAVTNSIAGVWTWAYSPETGGRSFEENAQFFHDAKEQNTWLVHKVNNGQFKYLPSPNKEDENGERAPLLRNS